MASIFRDVLAKARIEAGGLGAGKLRIRVSINVMDTGSQVEAALAALTRIRLGRRDINSETRLSQVLCR